MKILLVLTGVMALVGMAAGYWATVGLVLSAAYWIAVMNEVLRSEEALK